MGNPVSRSILISNEDDGAPLIRASDISRSFWTAGQRLEALGPTTLDIAAGSFVSIVGPSGCGKSTLLKIIAGLTRPSTGSLEIRRTRPASRPLAMVFQNYGIYPWKTVHDNVRFGLDLAGVPRRESNQIVTDWLGRMGISAFARAYPSTLSGGMLQRVSIARALASNPEVLLMDEPFAALDAQLRTLLQEELLALWEADRRTVVFVTHSIEEAIILSDRILVMSARPGRVIADIDVPFGRPRPLNVRADSHFGMLHEQIWELLRSEVDKSFGASSRASAP